MTSFNDLIWQTINELGWWYWWIPVAIGIYIAFQLVQLDAPKSTYGRVTRTITWAAIVPTWFMPAFNSLGMIAYPLTMLGAAMVITQIKWDCKARRMPAKTILTEAAHKTLKLFVE